MIICSTTNPKFIHPHYSNQGSHHTSTIGSHHISTIQGAIAGGPIHIATADHRYSTTPASGDVYSYRIPYNLSHNIIEHHPTHTLTRIPIQQQLGAIPQVQPQVQAQQV